MSRVTPQLSQQAGERIVGGDRRSPELERRIEHEERAAAVFDIFLDGVDFRLLVVVRGAGDDQRRAVGRHLGFLQQVDGLGLVFILGQQILEVGKAVALGVVDLMFAAAGHEANGAGGVFQVADERAGDALFRHALGVSFLSPICTTAVP